MFKKLLLTVCLILCGLQIVRANISGKVVDINSFKPLPLVKVTAAPQNLTTLTDANGIFYFEAEECEKLVFSRIGYQKQFKNFSANKEFIIVELMPKAVEIPGIKIKGEAANSIAGKTNNVEVIELNKNISENVIKTLENNSIISISQDATGQKQISFIGIDAKQTAILIDGVKVNSSGGNGIEYIPTSLIDKIEIAKGSNSTIAGSSAIGGVINFVLKDAQSVQKKHNISLNMGSWDNYGGNYQGSFYNDGLKALINIHTETTKNDFYYYNEIEDKELRRLNNGYTSNSIQLKLNHAWHTALNHKFTFYLQNSEKGIPGQTTDYMYYKDARSYSSLTRINSKTIFDLSPSILNLNLFYKGRENHYDNSNGDIFHRYNSMNNTEIISPELDWIYHKNAFSSNTSLKFRYESFKHKNLLSSAGEEDISNKFRRTLSLSHHNNYTLPTKAFSYKLSSGLRFDSIFEEENIFSFQAGLSLKPNFYKPLKFSLKAGNSYRLPQFTSLFWKGDSRVEGNPNLEPERALSLNANLDWKSKLNTFSFSAFINQIDYLIYWHRTALGIWTPDNLARAQVWGISSKFQIQPWDFMTISSNYSRIYPYNKTEDSDHYNNYLIYKPVYKWTNDLQIFYKRFNFFIKTKLKGKQFVNFDNTVELDGYNTIDTGGSIQFDLIKNFTANLNFTVKNLFSQSYEMYRNIPAAGRSYRMQLNLSYK